MMTAELKAFVDEYNCIGCSKCLRVCPTDAIVGAKKMLHTILPARCTSCSHCVDVCPTNCISLATPGEKISIEEEKRLIEQKKWRQESRLESNLVVNTFIPQPVATQTTKPSLAQRKQSVADAIARAKAKRAANNS